MTVRRTGVGQATKICLCTVITIIIIIIVVSSNEGIVHIENRSPYITEIN